MKNRLTILGLILLSVSTTSCHDFDRAQAEKDEQSLGKQILLKAESSKKAKIEEAKADFESSKLDAETRLIQAESKAKSIRIISNAIKENPEYTKFQLIESMKGANRIYIPTESGLPIIERK
jgi:regulator of protease activity HflC (stomatin/prohibitin superfamily)